MSLNDEEVKVTDDLANILCSHSARIQTQNTYKTDLSHRLSSPQASRLLPAFELLMQRAKCELQSCVAAGCGVCCAQTRGAAFCTPLKPDIPLIFNLLLTREILNVS